VNNVARSLAAPLALVVLSLAAPGCAELPPEPEAPAAAAPAPAPQPEPAPAPAAPAAPAPTEVAAPAPAPAPAVVEVIAPKPRPEPALAEAQKANYIGYTGVPWGKDYGVVQGRCNPAAAGDALGEKDGPRTVAVVVAGPGGEPLTRAMDARDRACLGHTLELVRKGSTSAWSNGETGIGYRVMMSHDYVHEGLPCREYSAVVAGKDGKESVKGGACRRPEAKWELYDRK
jgi:surface antigen